MKLCRRPSFKVTSPMLMWQVPSPNIQVQKQTSFVIKNEAGPKAQLQIDKFDARVTGGLEAQNLNGGWVARNVRRILLLFFFVFNGASILNRFEEFWRRGRSPELAWWWSRSKCPANTPPAFSNKWGGGVFLTDLRNSVEAQNLRGGGVAHNLVPNGVFCGVVWLFSLGSLILL